MKRMTDRLRLLVWEILCEGIDHPNLEENFTSEWTVEEVNFCIEWMKKTLGL